MMTVVAGRSDPDRRLACDMDCVTDDWEAAEWEYTPDVVAAWSTSYALYGH